jgi:DNA polymerase III delta prime subunit
MQPREQFVWVEKYRPQTLDQCILPAAVTASLNGILSQQNIPNLMLVGKAGVGKTTVAKALVRQLDSEAMVINASEENGIDVIREKIRDFASALSLTESRKYVILDEADYLHPSSTQPALRAFIEEFSATCGFILTANFPARIIGPLHSRCSIVDFKIPSAEKSAIAKRYMGRVETILTDEGVNYNQKLVANVVALYFPDFRRTLNEIQRHSSSGTLSEAILSSLTDKDINDLFVALKAREFSGVRKWAALHDDMDDVTFFRMLSEQLPKYIKDGQPLSEVIVRVGDYNYRAGLCADKQLNTLACLVEIMHEAEWR